MRKAAALLAFILVTAILVWFLVPSTSRTQLNSPPVDGRASNPSVIKNPKVNSPSTLTEAPAGTNRTNSISSSLPDEQRIAVDVRRKDLSSFIEHDPDFTNFPPEIVLEKLRTVFHSYQSMFGGNPVGTNREITQALNGGNPKQAHFLDEADGQRVNARGELIDSWGTPYFFHQLSGTEMEIHSAGPDKVMWTADDLVTK